MDEPRKRRPAPIPAIKEEGQKAPRSWRTEDEINYQIEERIRIRNNSGIEPRLRNLEESNTKMLMRMEENFTLLHYRQSQGEADRNRQHEENKECNAELMRRMDKSESALDGFKDKYRDGEQAKLNLDMVLTIAERMRSLGWLGRMLKRPIFWVIATLLSLLSAGVLTPIELWWQESHPTDKVTILPVPQTPQPQPTQSQPMQNLPAVPVKPLNPSILPDRNKVVGK